MLFENYKTSVPPTKLFFGSKLISQTDNMSTRVATSLSEPLTITHGIPQGSILRLTLFSLCMNDLPQVIKFSNIKSCVDDTKIYLSFTSKDIDSCLCQVAEDLKHVSEWYYANHLLINRETKIVCPVWGEATYLQVAQ